MTMHARGLPARICDLLETDGGWLTVEGIALALDYQNLESVRTALHRLRRRGLVEDRMVELASGTRHRKAAVRGAWNTMGVDVRTEWRLHVS